MSSSKKSSSTQPSSDALRRLSEREAELQALQAEKEAAAMAHAEKLAAAQTEVGRLAAEAATLRAQLQAADAAAEAEQEQVRDGICSEPRAFGQDG